MSFRVAPDKQVEPSFPFNDELHRIALAQALRDLAPEQVPSFVVRLFAYAAAGLCPVDEASDREAVRRHRLRPAGPTTAALTPITGSVNLGEAA